MSAGRFAVRAFNNHFRSVASSAFAIRPFAGLPGGFPSVAAHI
jgi:hypothetical protein